MPIYLKRVVFPFFALSFAASKISITFKLFTSEDKSVGFTVYLPEITPAKPQNPLIDIRLLSRDYG